jgi:hypothetical protein
MQKFLFSVTSIFILLFPALFLPLRAAARACPDIMPETLLSLYRKSDAIYEARYDKSEEGEILREDEDYTVVGIKRYFDLSTALKGETGKVFILEDEDYRYKGFINPPDTAEQEEPVAVEAASDAWSGDTADLIPGDRVLLFVKKDESGTKFELTEPGDSIKKLDTDGLSAYEARIKDLNSIFSAEAVSPEKIVEWLVRCAEDPKTRWEGTFELLQSVERLDWQQQIAKENAEAAAKGKQAEEVEAEVSDEEEYPFADVALFAKLLNDDQKQRLSNILLDSGHQAAGQIDGATNTAVHGDRELIELAKRWGDHRLAAHLLEQLRAGDGDPYGNSQLMSTIAEILNDAKLSSLASRYGDIYYYDEKDEVGEAKTDDAPVDVMTSEMVVIRDKTLDTATFSDAVAKEPQSDEGGTKRQTYKDLRGEIMAGFLAKGEKVIARLDAAAGILR